MKALYFHNNEIPGSLSLITNDEGQIEESRLYSPFGLLIAGEDTADEYGTDSKPRDSDTGFQDYGARWYNPSYGIWLSVDPVLMWPSEKLTAQGINIHPYGFNWGDPVNRTDPDGRDVEDIKLSKQVFLTNNGRRFTGQTKAFYIGGRVLNHGADITFSIVPGGVLASTAKTAFETCTQKQSYEDLAWKTAGVSSDIKATAIDATTFKGSKFGPVGVGTGLAKSSYNIYKDIKAHPQRMKELILYKHVTKMMEASGIGYINPVNPGLFEVSKDYLSRKGLSHSKHTSRLQRHMVNIFKTANQGIKAAAKATGHNLNNPNDLAKFDQMMTGAWNDLKEAEGRGVWLDNVK